MGDSPAPRGRAALLELLKKRKTSQVGVSLAPEPVEEPEPKLSGRAALLKKLQESRQKKVGVNPLISPSASTSSHVSGPGLTGNKDATAVIKEMEALIITEDTTKEKERVLYRGEAGKPVPLSSNYIRLAVEKNRGVFEYEVRFDPEVDSKRHRCKMVAQHMAEMGNTKQFDGGSVLYLPHKLPIDRSLFNCALPGGEPVVMAVLYKRQKRMGECIHLYNVLFKKIMRILSYSQMGRNYFNIADRIMIPQHRLEVYPGFAITVDELEGGLLLCLDTDHRVLRSQNAYELMLDLKGSPNFRELVNNAIIGSNVLTRYNNKTYVIDDISWDCTPNDTFELSDGKPSSFISYYKNNYGIEIKDENQPMLVHRQTIKFEGGKKDRMICLVPELCFLTGLTDAMRADFKVMKDVSMYTRITPAQRMNAFRTYLRNVANSEEAQDVLARWGLRIDTQPVDLQGRILEAEVMLFGENREFRSRNGDWSRGAGENKAMLPIDLLNWVIFHTSRDKQFAGKFADTMVRMASSMGCRIGHPRLVTLRDDRNESYVNAIAENVTKGVQCAVFICPTLRADRYGVIKKLCCTQQAVASQVILSKTLANDVKARSIIQKIALQINCKLGGSLWTVRFPVKNWMIVGIDVYHSAKGSKADSVCAIVASTNESFSRWFSIALPQKGELSEFYRKAFAQCLENYHKQQGTYPAKVVIFRDGVGDGQLEHCRRFEVSQFESTIKQFGLDITICFVVVQKRINTRIFLQSQGQYANPEPGTVLDNTVTRRYYNDFFLVPQNVRQGTVTPTHYIVLHDGCNMKPDHVQRLAYKLCHLYYNWSGTIRVPAPCQYAHKLAALYGQYLNKPVAPELANKLYYL